MKDEKLFGDEWLELRRLTDPENGVNGYTYYHEVRCNGAVVSVLPFRYLEDGSIEYLLRQEVTPCWTMEQVPSSFTGGVETEDPTEDALRELEEEAGFVVDQLIPLGTCRGPKCADTVYHLFAADVTGLQEGTHEGDGSAFEAAADNVWVKQIHAEDPLVYVLAMRLTQWLNGLWPVQ
jgi:hypothetical protein